MQYVYLDTYISGCLCGLNTSMLHKSNCTIYIDLAVWNIKLENCLILSLKFYFERKISSNVLFTH